MTLLLLVLVLYAWIVAGVLLFAGAVYAGGLLFEAWCQRVMS